VYRERDVECWRVEVVGWTLHVLIAAAQFGALI
jgi:hypothetical protein